jgi:hypothetical protein
MKIFLLVALQLVFPMVLLGGQGESTAKDRELIEAAYHLRIDEVIKLLADGADVNASYGDHDAEEKFRDPWKLGYPMAYQKWTAILALSEGSIWPPPSRKVENTEADLDWSLREAAKVTEKDKDKSRSLKLQIAQILIKAGADLNADDGHGATPVYNSATDTSGFLFLLIQQGARVNSKTGIYIDGLGDKTALHLAVHEPDNLAVLIQAGADLNVVDTAGDTPLHSAVAAGKPASVKLLLDAGADPKIRNKSGRSPSELLDIDESSSVREIAISRLFYEKQAKAIEPQKENH